MAIELDTLRLLHSIRQELFAYNNSATPHNEVESLLKDYLILLPEKTATQTYLKVLANLQAKTLQTNFELEAWRKLAIEDKEASKTQSKAVKNENAKRSKNNKKFKQEDAIKQKILNELELNGCDLTKRDLLSVRVESGKKLVAAFSDGSTETINIFRNGKKNVTSAFWSLKIKIDSASSSLKKKELLKQQENFLSPLQLQTLVDNGEMTFATVKQEMVATKPAHKNMTFAQYKKLAGATELLPDIEKEYEIYSNLSFIHQEKFLEEIKIRKEYMDKSIKVFKGLCHDAQNVENLKQIADKSFLLNKLSETLSISSKAPILQQVSSVLPSKEAFEKAVSDVLMQIVETDIKGEIGQQYIWSNFNKAEKNPRYSPYEILLDRAVNASPTIRSEIFHFNNKQQMQQNIAEALSEIKSQNKGFLPLPNSLAAEILCIGVFNIGMQRAQTAEDLTKMNEILNELGLNIRFEERKITKIPPQATSNECLAAERVAFREDAAHKSLTDAFDKSLVQKFGALPHKKEVHHFIPLRYNGFIDEELNKGTNYVAVATQHDYNLDLHGLGHTFDTPSNSLVKDENGDISSMIYSKMQKEGVGKTLMIPILQLKTDNGFEDVLSAQKHRQISTDKTPVCYVQIPERILEMMHEKKIAQDKLKKPVHALS